MLDILLVYCFVIRPCVANFGTLSKYQYVVTVHSMSLWLQAAVFYVVTGKVLFHVLVSVFLWKLAGCGYFLGHGGSRKALCATQCCNVYYCIHILVHTELLDYGSTTVCVLLTNLCQTNTSTLFYTNPNINLIFIYLFVPTSLSSLFQFHF